MSVQKIRRCREEREDFTEKDAAIFPIKILDYGESYSFCPAKATWDFRIVDLYKKILFYLEFKTVKLEELSYFEYELLTDIVLKYDLMKFLQKVDIILGDDTKKPNKDVKKWQSQKTF